MVGVNFSYRDNPPVGHHHPAHGRTGRRVVPDLGRRQRDRRHRRGRGQARVQGPYVVAVVPGRRHVGIDTRASSTAALASPGATTTGWSSGWTPGANGSYRVEATPVDSGRAVGDHGGGRLHVPRRRPHTQRLVADARSDHRARHPSGSPGSANDDLGVGAVKLAIRNMNTGLWLQPDDTWAATRVERAAALGSPGADGHVVDVHVQSRRARLVLARGDRHGLDRSAVDHRAWWRSRTTTRAPGPPSSPRRRRASRCRRRRWDSAVRRPTTSA